MKKRKNIFWRRLPFDGNLKIAKPSNRMNLDFLSLFSFINLGGGYSVGFPTTLKGLNRYFLLIMNILKNEFPKLKIILCRLSTKEEPQSAS